MGIKKKMTFKEAFEKFKEGKKIQCLSSSKNFLLVSGLNCKNPSLDMNDFIKQAELSLYDIMDEWRVVEKPRKPKLHSFGGALHALKQGKSVKRNGANFKIVLRNGKFVNAINVDEIVKFDDDAILANDWIIYK